MDSGVFNKHYHLMPSWCLGHFPLNASNQLQRTVLSQSRLNIFAVVLQRITDG